MWVHIDAARFPRSERTVGSSPSHAIASLVRTEIIGVGKIVTAIVLEYPRAFVEVFHARHLYGCAIKGRPVISFQFASIGMGSAADVDIRLSVVIDKHVGVNAWGQSFNYFLYFESLCRVAAGRNEDAERSAPVVAIGWMGKIVIIKVFIGVVNAVGCPHEAGTGKAKLIIDIFRFQYLAVVCPLMHVFGGIYMVSVHAVTAHGRFHVV